MNEIDKFNDPLDIPHSSTKHFYTLYASFPAMTSVIWSEKYRPLKFSEMRGQKDVVERIEAFVDQKNMPHLLFAGPAGTGKSTLALIIARKLFGDEFRRNFLELNASDERGIDVIRNIVKDFARTKSIGDVPFKIVFLDECDALTKDAQHALRRTMETFSRTTRFVLSCNFSSKIIDPIQSRCAVFRFRPLEKKDIARIIEHIAKEEGLTVTEDAVEALFNVSGGDCRRLENVMQSCGATAKKVTEDLVYSISSYAKPKEVKEFLELALKEDFVKARNKMLDTMLQYGLSGLDIVKQIQAQIWELDIDSRRKVELVDRCGEAEFRMVEGSDEFIQLEALLANFMVKK